MRDRSVLVVLTYSENWTPAMRRAIALARAGSCRLQLSLFDHDAAIDAVAYVSKDVADLARQARVAERADWLEKRADALRKTGLEVATEVIWGRPLHHMILERVAALQPDLVVKDIESESALRRVLLTPTDWHLLRECSSPLMLVNPHAHPLPGRVIAAVEPVMTEHTSGELNERILGVAQDVAALCGTEAELAYVIENPSPVVIADPAPYTAALEQAWQEMRRQRLARFSKYADAHGVPPARRHTSYGSPWLALAELAGDSALDLLVLGAVQRTKIERALIGSTAERILSEARCDLLSVRPASHGSRKLFQEQPKRRKRRAVANPSVGAKA